MKLIPIMTIFAIPTPAKILPTAAKILTPYSLANRPAFLRNLQSPKANFKKIIPQTKVGGDTNYASLVTLLK